MNFGKVTIPTKWSEVTLKQFMQLMEIYEKENRDMLDILELFSGKTRNELRLMPSDFIETMLVHLQFMNDQLNVEPNSEITINGETYKVNYMEKLKLGEWVDSDEALKVKNYPAMLAILARKDGEIYDDDFIANKLDERVKMFEELPIDQAMILVNFFLKLNLQSKIYSPKCLGKAKEVVESLVQCTRNSLPTGVGNIFSILSAKIKLRRLEKQLRAI